MKKRNYVIIGLLVIGIVMFGIVEIVIKPEKAKTEEKYISEQEDSLTHDFKRVLKYKTKYMGDNSAVMNINDNLLLNNIKHTYKLEPENLKIIITYEEKSENFNNDKLKRDLLYNATANFVLIDNLKEIIFQFNDEEYIVKREEVINWYSSDLNLLQDEANWKEKVQDKLKDKDDVNKFWNEEV